jgi:hypothetical protein
MLERRKETALLMRLFVDAIAPGMDLFDFDAYFSRIIPLKATNSILLQSALAAVAAKFVAQTLLITPDIADFNILATITKTVGCASLQEWFYKAASYYDKGISSLRIYLHRWTHKLPQAPLGEAGFQSSPQLQDAVLHSSVHKKRRLNTITSATNDVEDLLSAISVLSLYETLDNPETGYLQ